MLPALLILARILDIQLFVKLLRWFEIETPIGSYNPDWAVVKHDDATIYPVREIKGTKDFENSAIPKPTASAVGASILRR